MVDTIMHARALLVQQTFPPDLTPHHRFPIPPSPHQPFAPSRETPFLNPPSPHHLIRLVRPDLCEALASARWNVEDLSAVMRVEFADDLGQPSLVRITSLQCHQPIA